MNADAWTANWEGCRLAVYDDHDGHVLAVGEMPIGRATVGRGHTGPDVVPGDTWTQARVDGAFAQDLGRAGSAVGSFPGATDAQIGVLRDMAFELGAGGFRSFILMLSAVRIGDYVGAAQQILDSHYATESPRRAQANAAVMKSGTWITPHPNDPSIT